MTPAPSPHPLPREATVVQAQCGTRALFHHMDVVGQRVKLHYTQQIQGRLPSKFRIVICVDDTPFWKASATHGDVYIDSEDSTHNVGRPSPWSTWFTFDRSHYADLLRLARKLGQLDAQVA